AERNERGGVHGLVGPGRLRATRTGLADGLEEREGEHLDLGRAARAGSGDDALTASRKIDETGGDAHPGTVFAVRFERREERRYHAGRGRQLGLIDLHFTWDAGRRSHDDVIGRRHIDLRNSYAHTAARDSIERLEARQLRPEGAFATYGCTGVGHNFGRAVLPRADDQVANAISPIATLTLPSKPGNGMIVARNRSPLPSYRRTSAGLPGAPGTATA